MPGCSVYCTIPLFWLVVHPFIERWRKRGRRAFSLILPIWAVFIAAAFTADMAVSVALALCELVDLDSGRLSVWIGFSIYAQAFRGFHSLAGVGPR